MPSLRCAAPVRLGQLRQCTRGGRLGAGQTCFCQVFAGSVQQAQPRVLLAARVDGPGSTEQAGGDDDADQHATQVFPAGRLKTDVFEQIQLLTLAVVEYPLVPGVVDRLPARAQLRCQRGVEYGAESCRHYALARHQAFHAADAPGSDGARWVHAHPAATGLPDLGPGVRVALAHRPESVHRIHVAALIARYHTCRYIHGAQQNHKTRCDMLTKPFLAVKPEFVGGVLPKHAGFEGVAVTSCAQTAHDFRHQQIRLRIGKTGVAPDFCGKLRRAGVKAIGQLSEILQANDVAQGPVGKRGLALRLIAQQIGDRAVADPLQISGHGDIMASDLGLGTGGFEDKDPGAVVLFQRDLVGDGRT